MSHLTRGNFYPTPPLGPEDVARHVIGPIGEVTISFMLNRHIIVPDVVDLKLYL